MTAPEDALPETLIIPAAALTLHETVDKFRAVLLDNYESFAKTMPEFPRIKIGWEGWPYTLEIQLIPQDGESREVRTDRFRTMLQQLLTDRKDLFVALVKSRSMVDALDATNNIYEWVEYRGFDCGLSSRSWFVRVKLWLAFHLPF